MLLYQQRKNVKVAETTSLYILSKEKEGKKDSKLITMWFTMW